jgi:hypothetical protein
VLCRKYEKVQDEDTTMVIKMHIYAESEAVLSMPAYILW